ncbi:MAG: transglutaminase family protein [Pirellulales bacterium]|nr:transglutaminase family protein [Pirellulales bacterium]
MRIGMLFHIKHTTRYSYSAPVFCEPLTLRLQPRSEGGQRLLRYRLWIEPRPAGVCTCLEHDGSTVERVWFDGTNAALTVTSMSVVETLRTNPFDYLLEPRAMHLATLYTAAERELLAPYLRPQCLADPVAQLSFQLARRVNQETPLFLLGLAGWIYDAIEPVIRLEGPSHQAVETLALRRGACRDTAMLFIDVCRHAGLAARFVSGYQEGDARRMDRHLHAWAEVYLPGAGWRGYDPSHGLAVADGHVALATSALPELAAAITGNFRGNGVTSSLETELSIRTRVAGAPAPGQGFADATGEGDALFGTAYSEMRQSTAPLPR